MHMWHGAVPIVEDADRIFPRANVVELRHEGDGAG